MKVDHIKIGKGSINNIQHILKNYCARSVHVQSLHNKEVYRLEFGSVLRKMRKGASLSQEALAEKLHISRSNVSRLETDDLQLKASDLIKWAKVTENQDLIAAMLLGIDVVVLQQALEMVSKFVATITLGGII